MSQATPQHLEALTQWVGKVLDGLEYVPPEARRPRIFHHLGVAYQMGRDDAERELKEHIPKLVIAQIPQALDEAQRRQLLEMIKRLGFEGPPAPAPVVVDPDARGRIFADIIEERRRQETQHGERSISRVVSLLKKSTILSEEAGEVAKAVNDLDELESYDKDIAAAAIGDFKERLREELVQVAATAVAWLEGMDTPAPAAETPQRPPPTTIPSGGTFRQDGGR